MIFKEVKKTIDCVKIAASESENKPAMFGWHLSLKKVYNEIDKVNVLGQTAKYVGLVQQGNQILMLTKKDRSSAAVSLSSIDFLDVPPYVKVWTQAYISIENDLN